METGMALGVGHYAVKVVADSEGHGPARWPSLMRQAAGTRPRPAYRTLRSERASWIWVA